MTIRASGHSALILAAALIAASAFGFAGTGASYAAANGTMQLATEAPADASTVTPSAADVHAASSEQQSAPAAPSPFAGSTVAENTDTTAATASSDATANAVATSSDDSSGWDKASIIGKIFIACGTLLTLGSAARMFMI
ncbi:hypothetical protein [Bradyrhizobium sp. STM 3557]|uniref:hypothetical protein n=1 Tax=Bradyrhizobium sp. STM 3557 TaxID=578920 RepID=UPI00389069EC